MYQNTYEQVTNVIISKLEQGIKPWKKPWTGEDLTLPLNKITGNYYRGINIPILWLTAEEKGYSVNEWASFNQWSDKKESIRKGEKGTVIVYYDTIKKVKDDVEEKIPFIKTSVVFNKCQLKGYDQDKELKIIHDKPEAIKHVEQFIANTGAMVYPDGGNRAFYNLRTDDIHMPLLSQFKSAEDYYSVNLHELTHWTMTPERCNRKIFEKRFPVGWYAMEELVAEMGAAFLCATLHISDHPRTEHADYIGHWLEVMKEDNKAIFTAASAASKASDYLHGLQPK